MRAYCLTVVKVFFCLSLAAVAGCVSSGAKPPAANAPCKTTDDCPSAYQCFLATTGASGLFCCQDKNSCGPSSSGGEGGARIDGAIVSDGPSSKGGVSGTGIDNDHVGAGGIGGTGDIDAVASGGEGGADTPIAAGGIAGTGGIVGAGGGTTADAPMGTGGVVGAGGLVGSGGVAVGSGGIVGTGGIGKTGGIVGTGGMAGTGGIVRTGGAGSGGIVTTGGIVGNGGMIGTGGSTGTGGGTTTVGQYVVSADGLIVTDTSTGLVWQRDGSGSRANCAQNPACTWAESQAYCTGLTLDGSGWHLPTLTELQSIVDTTVTSGPKINQTAFPNTPAGAFWTSTPVAGLSSGALMVTFYGGGSGPYDVSNPFHVRCVRSDGVVGTGGVVGSGGIVVTGGIVGSGGMVGTGGATGTGGGNTVVGHYVVSADGIIVTDTSTGLVWQRDGSGSRPNCAQNPQCTWAESQAYCTGLTLDGSGWRWPTLTELQSIVDTTVTSGATINQTAFPNTPAVDFWTSSPSAGSSGGALCVSFYNGGTYNSVVGDVLKVRCVR